MSKFAPMRHAHLAERLAEDFFAAPEDRRRFFDFVRLVGDLERHYAGSHLKVYQDLYAPYDPDDESVPPATVSPEHDREQVERLFDWLESAFLKANFERVADARFAAAVAATSLRAKSLKVDPDLRSVERFAIFQRGTGRKATTVRPAKKLFRVVEIESATYSRVAVIVRSRKDPRIHVKLYKDVPQDDVDLILPTLKLRMRWIDRLKLGGSGGAAAISFVKMTKLLVFWAPKIALAPMKVLLLPIVVLMGAIYGGKTLMDYGKIKASYLTALSEQLFALGLAANRGALSHLAELVAEEEAKEVLVGYAFVRAAGPAGCTPARLGELASAWLRQKTATFVAFDVPDALAKLEERGLVTVLPDGARVAVSLEDAIARLDRTWDDLFVPERAEAGHLSI